MVRSFAADPSLPPILFSKNVLGGTTALRSHFGCGGRSFFTNFRKPAMSLPHLTALQWLLAITAALSVGHFGITAPLVIDVATFAIAALLYLRFRGLSYDAPRSGDVSRRELAASIWRNPVLFGLVGSFTLVTAAIGTVNAGLPEFVQVQLGQQNGYGYALSAIGAGLLVGELITGFIRREATTYRTIPIAFATTAANRST